MTHSKDGYPPEEARHRFEAALRGAREVGHEPMKDMPKKRAKKQAGTPKLRSARKDEK
jgi:hypothetical protein